MKRLLVVISLVFICSNSVASDDFSSRESRAKKLERSPAGLEYLMGFMQDVDAETTKIMGDCFNSGEVGTTDTFTIVADIQADGRITDVAVHPATDQTKCYADKFGRVKAPLLPSQFQSAGFPIVIHASQTYKGAP